MKYFDQEHRVGADTCAITSTENQNKRIEDYMLFNTQRTNVLDCKDKVDNVKDFMANNHMFIKDGYGYTNACRIDHDSKIRMNPNINDRSKNQMFTRTFQAVPDLSRGDVNTESESKIQQGETTYNDFECHGRSLDVFMPMLSCLQNTIQDPQNIIPDWKWGGETTRDTLKQKEFLEKNGYHFDGNAWNKKNCN